MKHEFSEELRADPERFAFAERAAKQLDAITANTMTRATAQWRVNTNPPNLSPYRMVLEVVLRDDEGTVLTGELTEYELNDPLELRYRIARIWGDLLEQSFHNFYHRVNQTTPEIGVVHQ